MDSGQIGQGFYSTRRDAGSPDGKIGGARNFSGGEQNGGTRNFIRFTLSY